MVAIHFQCFNCARAAQNNVLDAELCLPASQRAGQRGTYTSVKESENLYCISLCSGDTGF